MSARRRSLIALLVLGCGLGAALVFFRRTAQPADDCEITRVRATDRCTLQSFGTVVAEFDLRCGETRTVCGQPVRCDCLANVSSNPTSRPAAPPPKPVHSTPDGGAPPRLQPLPPEVEGNRSADVAEVERAVEALRPLILECLQDAQHLGDDEVRVTVGFTVLSGEGAGRLSRPVVDLTVTDPYLLACVEDSVEDARFPSGRPPAPIRARQTFIFR